jgi:hypothetical protein
MAIPYRDEQILRILAANPDGLTTGQILAIAKTQRGNELPDSNITSQRIYSLRGTKLPKLRSIDSPAGRIHKITAHGLDLLNEIDTIDNRRAIKPAAEPVAQNTPDNMPVCEISQTDAPAEGPENRTIEPSPLTQAMQEVFKEAPAKVEQPQIPDIDPLAEFDKAVAIMREAMLTVLIEQTYPEPWPKIADMPAKIELLEKLECMTLLNPDARDLIRAIRLDIEQMDAE